MYAIRSYYVNDAYIYLSNTGEYLYRVKGISQDLNGAKDGLDSGLQRTVGWHKFTFDYSDPTKIVLMIDDDESSKRFVNAASGETSSFRYISAVNYWGSTDPSKAGLEPIYIDDITIIV